MEDWERVAEAVKDRRIELGLTQQQAVDAAGEGISVPVWAVIENARRDRYRDRTIAAVERALQWHRGSVSSLLAGGEPTIARTTTIVTKGLTTAEYIENLKVAVQMFDERMDIVESLLGEAIGRIAMLEDALEGDEDAKARLAEPAEGTLGASIRNYRASGQRAREIAAARADHLLQLAAEGEVTLTRDEIDRRSSATGRPSVPEDRFEH